MKKELPIESRWVTSYMSNGQTTLISCTNLEGTIRNTLAVAWTIPTSFDPPLFLISIGHDPRGRLAYRFSHHLILESNEFVINVPTAELKREVLLAGTLHGEKGDKFERAGLTPIEAKTVKSPLIEECIMNIECKVVDSFETGDHTVFVGRPTAIWCNEDAIKKGGIDRRYKRKDSMIHATDLLP